MRKKGMLLLFLALFALLAGVVLHIAVFQSERYASRAASQRLDEKTLKVWRGGIVDRDFVPFVDGRGEAAEEAGRTVRIPRRYDGQSLARHLIGYTDAENTGVSGLEKAFEDILHTDVAYRVTGLKDARSNPISSVGISTENANYTPEKNLQLTLDYHIQETVEQAMDTMAHNGAVVVMDVQTFDVLAMASRPNYDQNNVQAALESDGTQLMNRALSPYNAGSIFKIVTAAAGLEAGVCTPDTHYWCEGKTGVGGVEFFCQHRDGHGELPLHSAFALSCNMAFYDIGAKTGGHALMDMARRFGLGQPLLGEIGLPESAGNVPEKEQYPEAEVANLSIGQGELLLTPLQAANMACIIANGGWQRPVNLAAGIVDAQGYTVQNLRRFGARRVVSDEIAGAIGQMMLETTTAGTGTNAQLPQGAAGKTSTAETGWEGGAGLMVHGWFIGYFPYDSPKYAMAVLAEDGRQGNAACAPLFQQIAQTLLAEEN